YVHMEDNIVHYFTMQKDVSGKRKFESCEPQMFHVGDIVQLQLSFVVIPVKGGH
ncbi:hypothetical protein L208DRAFT_1278171, partial [Tricholoma matsutake]